jgi:hypothetical protein
MRNVVFITEEPENGIVGRGMILTHAAARFLQKPVARS